MFKRARYEVAYAVGSKGGICTVEAGSTKEAKESALYFIGKQHNVTKELITIDKVTICPVAAKAS